MNAVSGHVYPLVGIEVSYYDSCSRSIRRRASTGIADEDIEQVVTHAMAIDHTDDDARLYIGPARNAALLEVLTIPTVEGSELAIRAMPMRPKYRPRLSEQ